MKTRITVTVLIAVLSIGLHAQEPQPLAWAAAHRDVANVLSNVTLGSQVLLDAHQGWRAPNRWHAMRCQALRFGVALGAAELTKSLVHRTRPDGSDDRSFFSGHTATAASMSNWSARIGVPIALGTGYLRMGANRHYGSDVAAGFGVGWLATKACRP